MFEPTKLSLARLAVRWDRTIEEILDLAQELGIPLYFAFNGLAFDRSDSWHRFHGAQKEMAERERLTHSIGNIEDQIVRAQHGQLTQWENIPQGGVQELRAEVEDMRRQVRLISDLLDQRETERMQCELGYLRAGPGTLKDISEMGEVPFPRWGFHPATRVQGVIANDERGHPVLDWTGRLMHLEPRFEKDPRWHRSITAEMLFATMVEVKAFEAAQLRDPRVQVEQPNPTAVSETKTLPGIQPSWELKKPDRFQGYGRPLYDLVKAAHVAGLPVPTAYDIIDAFRLRPPPEVTEVMSDGLKYYDSEGGTKFADRSAVKKAVQRLVIDTSGPAE